MKRKNDNMEKSKRNLFMDGTEYEVVEDDAGFAVNLHSAQKELWDTPLDENLDVYPMGTFRGVKSDGWLLVGLIDSLKRLVSNGGKAKNRRFSNIAPPPPPDDNIVPPAIK